MGMTIRKEKGYMSNEGTTYIQFVLQEKEGQEGGHGTAGTLSGGGEGRAAEGGAPAWQRCSSLEYRRD